MLPHTCSCPGLLLLNFGNKTGLLPKLSISHSFHFPYVCRSVSPCGAALALCFMLSINEVQSLFARKDEHAGPLSGCARDLHPLDYAMSGEQEKALKIK